MTPITQSLDQFEILRALISELTEQSAHVRDAVAVLRLEAANRHTEYKGVVEDLTARIDGVVLEVDAVKRAVEDIRTDGRRVDKMVQAHEARIASLEAIIKVLNGQVEDMRRDMHEDRSSFRRALDEAATDRRAETEAIKAHMDRLEKSLRDSDTTTAQISEAVGAVVNELGIEDKVSLGRKLGPGEKADPKLEKLDKRSGVTLVANVIIAIGMVAQLIQHLLHK